MLQAASSGVESICRTRSTPGIVKIAATRVAQVRTKTWMPESSL